MTRRRPSADTTKNAAILRDRGVRHVHRNLPRAPSLELSVLPNGGGQNTWLARVRPTRFISGAEGDRTPDLCSAIAALSQLSYSPAVAPAGHGRIRSPSGLPDRNGPAMRAGPPS